MGLVGSLRSSGWNTPTIVGTALAAAGVIVALAAWLAPQSPDEDPKSTYNPQASASTTASPAAKIATREELPSESATPPPPPSSMRLLADLSPVTGSAYFSVERTAGHQALKIRCASGQTNDMFREIQWSIVGSYDRVAGKVAISGAIDPESRVQVEWFADGIRIYNASGLMLGGNHPFNAAMDGKHDLRVRVTCEDSAAIATLLDTAVTR